jgi:hypothetical protein
VKIDDLSDASTRFAMRCIRSLLGALVFSTCLTAAHADPTAAPAATIPSPATATPATSEAPDARVAAAGNALALATPSSVQCELPPQLRRSFGATIQVPGKVQSLTLRECTERGGREIRTARLEGPAKAAGPE